MPFSRFVTFLALLLLCSVNLLADQYEAFAENGKYGLKNTTSGEVVIPPQYESIGWSDGSFKIVNNVIGARQNEKWALIEIDGGKISSHRYANLTPFIDNLFIASQREKYSILTHFGLINARGKTIIDFDYSRIQRVDDLLVASKKAGQDYKYGILNKGGRSIIPFEFKLISPIKEGFFAVQNGEKLSAIYTAQGRAITDFRFESVEELTSNLFLVTYYNKRGLLDVNGNLVVEPIYKNIQLSGSKARALPFKKWDLYDDKNFQKSFYFDKMRIIDPQTFAVTSGRQTGLIDQEENYDEYLSGLSVVNSINGITIVEGSESGYQGAIESTGKTILPTNYDAIRVIGDVLFGQIKRIDKQDWTVFNRSGNKVSPFNYESFELLKNGLIKASRNGKKGLLTNSGDELSPFIYDNIGEFKNGLAVVDYQDRVGVINTNGNWVITPYNDDIDILDDIIKIKQASEWKLASYDGREKVRSYDEIIPLSMGYAKRGKTGYQLYNANDSLWLEHTYDTIQFIHSDLYALSRDNRFFFFKPSNEASFALDSGVVKVGQYSEGLIRVLRDNQWGQVNEAGQLRIANRYDDIQSFSEGLSAVKLIGKWGFIDKNETLVVQPIYDEVTPIYRGLSVVKKGDKYGLMDTAGKLILPEDFTSINRQENYIILNSNGQHGLADSKGKLIRTPQYDSIKALPNGYFLIARDGLKGIINLQGQDVVPLSYEAIEQMGNRFLASEPSEWILIDVK